MVSLQDVYWLTVPKLVSLFQFLPTVPCSSDSYWTSLWSSGSLIHEHIFKHIYSLLYGNAGFYLLILCFDIWTIAHGRILQTQWYWAHCLCSHPIGWNSITWPYGNAKESYKCDLNIVPRFVAWHQSLVHCKTLYSEVWGHNSGVEDSPVSSSLSLWKISTSQIVQNRTHVLCPLTPSLGFLHLKVRLSGVCLAVGALGWGWLAWLWAPPELKWHILTLTLIPNPHVQS